jgi:hypothetical protein
METKQLEQERAELKSILNEGFTFDVEDTSFEVEKRFFGLVRRCVPKKEKRLFRIEEPTLGTLDRISLEWIKIAIDAEAFKQDGRPDVFALSAKHSGRLAKVIALAVLGSDYLIPSPGKGSVRYREDTAKLEELTALFVRTLTPSRLFRIAAAVADSCNLEDFLNSIRLMSAGRTTMPYLVEENNGV